MTSTPNGLFPLGLTHSTDSWDATWTNALGKQWRLILALLGVLLFLTGFWYPLGDPDLGMHIATGEWIVRRRQFPLVEPFAWTRAGAPFQAYSWLPEVTYFLLIDGIGPSALHVLHGLSIVVVAASIIPLGRVLGWSAWAILITTVGHVMVALSVAIFLRPQLILFMCMPLAWALVYRAREATDLRWPLAGLIVLSTVMVNSHLLFPLLGVPCLLLLTHLPQQRWRIAVIPAAIVVGWLCTPYLFELPAIFQLNFGANAMLGPPSAISEYRPGFEVLMDFDDLTAISVAVCALLPWMLGPRMNTAERLLHGLVWLVGMVLFGLAVRALAVWWLVALPMVGTAIGILPDPVLPTVRLAQRGILLVMAALFAGQAWDARSDPFFADGDAGVRTLPAIAARGTEPLLRWLDCHVPGRPATKLLTVHSYGSYLAWRTPWLSESMDGRTIFPDSANRGEGYIRLPVRELELPPWRSADLAIVPSNYTVAAVLDTASGWRRVAQVADLRGRAQMIGLWARDSWWSANANVPMPERTIGLYHRIPVTKPDCGRPPIERVVRGAGSFDALSGTLQ